LLLVPLAAVWASSVYAREADVLDFKSRLPNASPGGTVVTYQLGTDGASEAVARSMRSHLAQSSFGGNTLDSTVANMNLDSLPTSNHAIPRWMQDRRVPLHAVPGIPLGFESGFKLGTFEHCGGARYLPTWWLSRETESRRALNFGTVAAIACEFGIPTNLLDAVIIQESGYKSWVISSAGAMGIMQIMPGTARQLGLANPFNPMANMRAGARYLRQQLDRFGRVDLALAAYNAGPERRALQQGYVPAIPETRNYVRTITTNWARLARMGVETTDAEIRGNVAMTAVLASGYRSVELVRYDGLNASNPM
jgi:hypothetical protein